MTDSGTHDLDYLLGEVIDQYLEEQGTADSSDGTPDKREAND